MNIEMHPDYSAARKKLRDIRRYIRTPLSNADVVSFGNMWNEALEKDERGLQAVRWSLI